MNHDSFEEEGTEAALDTLLNPLPLPLPLLLAATSSARDTDDVDDGPVPDGELATPAVGFSSHLRMFSYVTNVTMHAGTERKRVSVMPR